MRATSLVLRPLAVCALLLAALDAHAQTFSCAAQTPEFVAVRSRGMAELVAPVVITCSGTKPAGGIVGSIHVSLNVPITSRALGSEAPATEALLLEDNPAPGAQLGRPAGADVPGANVHQGFYNGGTVVWQTLQVAAPGAPGPFTKEFRIVNIRANVTSLNAPATVAMSITMLTNPYGPLTGAPVNVGTVTASPGAAARTLDDATDYNGVFDGCVGNRSFVQADTPRDFNVRFSEGNGSEFRKRNIAVSANSTTGLANQNQPQVIYGTETGFYNSTLPAVNSMNFAGLAVTGTRLMARFTGVPSGVSLFVTITPVTEGTSSPSFAARLTAADGNGAGQFSPLPAAAGPYAQLTVVNGTAVAVWEVLESNPNDLEYVSFGVILSIPENSPTYGKMRLQGGVAPLTTGSPGAAFAAPLFSALPPGREVAEVRTCATLLSVASSCPLTPASVGQSYNIPVGATGGTPPYAWTLQSGALPLGLNLNNNGFITGSPQVAGTTTFVLKVIDFFGAMATKECSMTALSTLAVTTACPLPDASVGVAYSQLLAATGGQPTYLWLLGEGTLPPGISLSPTGVLNGLPTVAGNWAFKLKVQDSLLYTAERACQLRVNGPFRVSPSELTFRAVSGAPAPAQMLSVWGQTAGQSFTARSATSNGTPWLRVSPANGTLPAAIQVSADASGLAPGRYTGEVTVAALNLGQQAQPASVTLIVEAADGPKLSVEPGGVTLAAPRASGAVRRSLRVLNAGSGSLSYTASVAPLTGSGWIAVTPASGTVTPESPGAVRVEMNTSALDVGVHRAVVTMTSAGGEMASVPVTLAVSSGRDLLELSQTGLTFTVVAGGPAPAQQDVTIQSGGAGSFQWDASVAADGGASWLALTQASGTAPAGGASTMGVRVNPGGLAAGTYFAEVRVRAAGIENSPRTVLVALRVLPAGANPGLVLGPGALLFTTRSTAPDDLGQTVQVFNTTGAATAFEYSFPADNRIFTAATPDGKTVTAGSPARIQVRADVSGLGTGIYRSQLMVRGADDPRVQAVDLVLVVLASAVQPSAVTPEPREARSELACTTGSGLAIVPRTLGPGFSVASGLSTALDVMIIDRLGTPLRTGTVRALSSVESSPGVSLRHAGNGRWTGTWTPNLAAGGAVTLSYLAEDVDRGVSGCAHTRGLVEANAGAPYLPPNGVVSAASYQAYEPVAHGSLLAIYGSKLAGAPAQASSLPLPLQLSGTRASLGGVDMPLFYAGETNGLSQVNAQAPYLLPGNVTLPLVVRTPGGAALAEVVVAESMPGIFTVSANGQGQGIIVLGSDPSVIATAAHPARRGEVVVIYCGGLGRTRPVVIPGAPAPSDSLAGVAAPVTVTIGGKQAAVQFAGLTPGLVGLYQVNAVVPADAAAGGAVPVVVTTGGVSSPPVTMAVQ